MKIRINCHNDMYFLVTQVCFNILVLAPWRISSCSSIMNIYLVNPQDKKQICRSKKAPNFSCM